jgi:hypothetical protein
MPSDGWDMGAFGKVIGFLVRLAIFLLLVFFVIRTFVIIYDTNTKVNEVHEMLKRSK